MSAMPTYVLVCNVCGAEFRIAPCSVRNVGGVRAAASSLGWRHAIEMRTADGYATSADYCPSCIGRRGAPRVEAPEPAIVIPRRLAAYAATLIRFLLARGECAQESLAKETLSALNSGKML